MGIALVGIAVYFLLAQDKSSTYKFPSLIDIKNEVVKFFNNAVSGKSDNPVSKITGTVVNKGNEIVDSAVNSIKTSTFNLFKESVDNKVDSIGQSMGIEVNPDIKETESKSLPVFAVKIGTPAYFTINNKDKEIISYEVDWRDGKKENGKINEGEKKTLFHVWQNSGIYEIIFTIKNSNKTEKYNINISIF